MNATQAKVPTLSPFVPTYAAIFCTVEGIPQVVGVFTVDEFLARWGAGKQGLRWALIVNTETGVVITRLAHQSETGEKIA